MLIKFSAEFGITVAVKPIKQLVVFGSTSS